MKTEIDYIGAIRRGWWLILLLLALAVVTAFWLTSRERPVYETSATLVVAPSGDIEEPDEIVRALETLERRTVVATFARIPTTRESRDAVAGMLDLEDSDLRGFRIRGSVVPNTNLIRVSATGPNPDRVAAVANAAASLTAVEAEKLYRIYSLRTVASATPPRRPDYPDPQRNLIVAGFIGLALGLVAALALERVRTDRRIEGEP
ncbi:MAG: Wzz/FepE/Etk N-terminal domain-containing protein [Thermoanaerobaculia bacterium]|nr:Wzz/FepE/Etk N-terminal domain-containing protein [Thermoanaerobaculia bacterium]